MNDPKELNEKSVEDALVEMREAKARFDHTSLAIGYTVAKTQRQQRIEALADLIGSVVSPDDEGIIYEAIDELREIWRRTEDEPPTGFRLAALKEEGAPIDPKDRPRYDSQAATIKSFITREETYRDKLYRLRQKVRRLKKRMG